MEGPDGVALTDAGIAAYSRELHLQVEIAMMYMADLDRMAGDGAGVPVRLWGTIDSLLAAMARVADILWPAQGSRGKGEVKPRDRAAALRIQYRINPDADLPVELRARDARNALQHFAERIDAALADGSVVDVEVLLGGARSYDAVMGIVRVFDYELDLSKAGRELNELLVLIPDPDEFEVDIAP